MGETLSRAMSLAAGSEETQMSLAGRVRERRRPYLKATGELHGHSIAHELLIRKTFFLRSPFGYGGLNLC